MTVVLQDKDLLRADEGLLSVCPHLWVFEGPLCRRVQALHRVLQNLKQSDDIIVTLRESEIEQAVPLVERFISI